jgi:hypothetical protein
MEMRVRIRTSACVTQSAAHAACDAICAGGDNGKSSKISNPDMVKGKMGQKVKAKCRMRNDNDKEPVEINELI